MIPGWKHLLLLAVLACGPVPFCAGDEREWMATVYTGVVTSNNLQEIASFSGDYDDSYGLVVLALGRRLGTWREKVDLEWEGQVGKHFGDQTHLEFNGLLAARWLPFPWDRTLDTSFAFGAGLSWATEEPQSEQEAHGKTNRLLGYLLFEFEFDPAPESPWSVVLRTHHRSGAGGLFDDVRGASNALGIGVKCRF